MSKIFLGGTCNESSWREQLIPLLKINYFNPVVKDWTPECQIEEERQKWFICDYHLYVITPRMTGVFSIAEAVESTFKLGNKCIFCVITEDLDDNGNIIKFDEGQLRSLKAVENLIRKNSGKVCNSLLEIASYLS